MTKSTARAAAIGDASPSNEVADGAVGEGETSARPSSPKSWRTVAQLSDDEDLGPTTIYAALKSGRLRGVKVGRSTRILHKDWEAFQAALPAYEPGGDAFNKRRTAA